MCLNFIEVTNMCKFISILFILLLGNLLSVSSVYAQITNTKIKATNKCGYNIYFSLERYPHHAKHCGKRAHKWGSHLTLPTKAYAFGPRHVRIGCHYSLLWAKHYKNVYKSGKYEFKLMEPDRSFVIQKVSCPQDEK